MYASLLWGGQVDRKVSKMHVSIFVLRRLRCSEIFIQISWKFWETGSFRTSLSCTFGRSCRFRTLDRRSAACDVMLLSSNSRKEKTRQAKARLPAKDCTVIAKKIVSTILQWEANVKLQLSLFPLIKKAKMQRLLILIIAILERSPRAWIEWARSKADTGTHRRYNRNKTPQSPGISPGTRCTCGIGLVPFEKPVQFRPAIGPCFLCSNRFFANNGWTETHHCIIASCSVASNISLRVRGINPRSS